jgi:VIT1/CCC1 family predicted Fe2+/Mn2+ transporter
MKDARLALRVSNAIAIAMLFLTGHSFGRHIGGKPVRTGFAMVVLGAVLVGLTIALGG